MTKFKTYFRTFYFSIAAITILVLTVFVFMSLFGDYIMIKESGVKKIYFADNISPSHKIVIDKFNKLYKGKIEVVPIDLPFEKFSTNERKELLIRYLRSKSDRVDLFSVDQIWVPRFAKWTEPLSNYFPVPQRNQIIPQALESCFYKDQLVAVPLYFDIGLMYYRSDLLKKLPDYSVVKNELDNFITWEKFIRLGERMNLLAASSRRIKPSSAAVPIYRGEGGLKPTGNPFYLFPADNYEGLMCSFVELLESQNEKLFVNDSVKLNTRAAEKSLQLLVNLVHKYKLSPTVVSSFKETESYNYFLNNDGIFLRGWPGFLKWYRLNTNREDVAKQFEIAPLPHFEGGKPAGIIGGWNLMISKYSGKKSEALEFIKFLLSEEAQKVFFEVGGYLPVQAQIYSDRAYLKKNPELEFYSKLFRTGVRRPFLEKYTRYSDVIAHYLNLAIKKKITVKEALNKAERIINSGDLFIK